LRARGREGRRVDGAGRTLAEFQKEFPGEARCAAFLQARRWPDGFVCPACGKGRAVALKSRPRLFECLDCGRQTSLTAGLSAPILATTKIVCDRVRSLAAFGQILAG
jgi:transcription elongation factor Elf1